MPLFGPPNIDRLERSHNVRALLRVVRSHRWSEAIVILPAVDALGRLGDPRAAQSLLAAYQMRRDDGDQGNGGQGDGGQRRRLAFGAALAALGDQRALPLLYEAMAEAPGFEERGRELAVQAIRQLGSSAFEAAVPVGGQRALPRKHLLLVAQSPESRSAPTADSIGAPQAPAKRAHRHEQRAWLTVDGAHLIAGASGDPRACDLLSATLFSDVASDDDMAGAARGLGWSQDPRAVTPLMAALFMGLLLQRFEALARRSRQPLPPRIQALLRDLGLDARPYAPGGAPRGADTPQMLWLVATTALGRLRYQRAAEAILLGALYGAPDGLAGDAATATEISHAISQALRQTGGLPIITAAARAVRDARTDSGRLSYQTQVLKHALLQLGVAVPDLDPLDRAPRMSAPGDGEPAARVFAVLATDHLRLLAAFVRNEHVQALVRAELARRDGAACPVLCSVRGSATPTSRRVRSDTPAAQHVSRNSDRTDRSAPGAMGGDSRERIRAGGVPVTDSAVADVPPRPVLVGG